MAYRSLGVACSQGEVWRRVARDGPGDVRRSHTYLLGGDALRRGLSAVVLRARHPWRLLEACAGRPVRIVLNHLLTADSAAGHYSLLVATDGEHVVIHDPQLGPNRRLSRDELLALWRPRSVRSEITGQVLLALAAPNDHPAACPLCRTDFPLSVSCPGCRERIPLRPAVALGCARTDCRARTWDWVFCPFCDTVVPEAGAQTPAARAPLGFWMDLR
jgi:hypothetical protein